MTSPIVHSHRFCIAPMMGYTDKHGRYVLRSLSKHVRLYTEMISPYALLRGNRARLLDFDLSEHPVALQLGGHSPDLLAEASMIGEQWGYDEINLNIGCPSDRVQSGRFGACLMAEPHLVAECVAAIRSKVTIPVTVKTRIGIDQSDSYEFLKTFIENVHSAGCDTFIIHARKAWLKGLSPKENREIPPLDYSRVYRLKTEFPQLGIVINGGIRDLDAVETHLKFCDGVMLGRAAVENPYLLADVDARIFGAPASPLSRREVVNSIFPYIEKQLAHGEKLPSITRHLLGFFHNVKGARLWRRILSERAPAANAGLEVVQAALNAICEAT